MTYDYTTTHLPLDTQTLTEEAIWSIFLEAEIQKPDWVYIAKKLGFQLHSQTTSTAFFEGWYTFAQNVSPSWENLARALEKMKVNNTKVGKIREKTGTNGTPKCMPRCAQ